MNFFMYTWLFQPEYLQINWVDTDRAACIDCKLATINEIHTGHDSSVSGTPTATTLVYNETTRSFTCTSTGGPATTVTWRKGGATITINATYQQTQVVTNAITGDYQTVLSIDQNVIDVTDTYSCTVGNTRGTSAAIETTGDKSFYNPWCSVHCCTYAL